MLIKTKYKIARRVGAPIFEKTQSQKYAMRSERRSKGTGRKGGPRQRSDYGAQMLEKQKARFTYLLTERQFSNYVKKATGAKGNTVPILYGLLEQRLDNTAYRIGFAPTRSAAKQLVSHGHITVNGRRVNIPSYQLKSGDEVAIREGSKKKGLFNSLEERLKNNRPPAWLSLNEKLLTAKVVGVPHPERADMMFDLNAVIEFYSR